MWAHYASNHTGICMEYDLKDLNEKYILNWCYPVKYEDNYDYTNYMKHCLKNLQNGNMKKNGEF